MPPSLVLCPAELGPPLRTASSSPVSRASVTTRDTSAASLGRTMTAGRRSNPPMNTMRASSYPESPGAITRPSKSSRSCGIAGAMVFEREDVTSAPSSTEKSQRTVRRLRGGRWVRSVPYTRANPRPVTERTIPQGAAATAAPARFSVLLSTGTTSILLYVRLRVHLFFAACSAAHPIGEHSDRMSLICDLLVTYFARRGRRPSVQGAGRPDASLPARPALR